MPGYKDPEDRRFNSRMRYDQHKAWILQPDERSLMGSPLSRAGEMNVNYDDCKPAKNGRVSRKRSSE